MARAQTDLPNDFPDRVIREGLLQPDNLRALLRAVAPTVADHLAYERLQVAKPAALLDDWRKRERDLLVRIPFRDASGREVLICVLVEHQSTADQAMPLRLLVYAVLYWEQEWRAWEEHHERGQPLRLTPVIPVVLHTGQVAWDASRRLADLFEAPDEFKAWLPEWRMPLWDLPEHTAEELLRSGEPWWQALAVARAEREPPEEFQRVLREAMRQIEPLGTTRPVYWNQLLRMVLYWSLYRRPGREHAGLIEAARASQSDVRLKEEVTTMSHTLGQTWEEELCEKFSKRFREEYRAKEEELRAKEEELRAKEAELRAKEAALAEARGENAGYRETLRRVLEVRFPSLPEAVTQRIAAAEVDWLKAAVLRALKVASPEELLQP